MLTVQVAGFRVLYIDCDHFPISFTLIDHCKDPEHFHFDYFPTGTHLQRTFQFQRIIFFCHYQHYPFSIKFMYTKYNTVNNCWLGCELISQCFTLLPISQTSMGSLSPQQPVSPSLCAGSSHV